MMISKPFNPDQALSKPALRVLVKNYTRYLSKMGESPGVIKERANTLREELGLYEDIDTEFLTKAGIAGIMTAKAVIQTLKFQDYKKLTIQAIISVLQEELERMEHNEMMKRIRGKK